MSTDPRQVIDHSAMSRLQYIIIGLTVGLNALDGFDVLAISFAGPGMQLNGNSVAPAWALCSRWNSLAWQWAQSSLEVLLTG